MYNGLWESNNSVTMSNIISCISNTVVSLNLLIMLNYVLPQTFLIAGELALLSLPKNSGIT